MFLYSHLFKALIILTGVNAFSSVPSRRSKVSTMPKLVELHMATTTTTSNLSGKVIGKRHIYRLSPQSPIQTPYSIEERQYYAVGRNGSLKPVTDKFVIVRGEVTQQGGDVSAGGVNPSEQTVIGPALYGMAGLQDGSDLLELESSSVDSSYAMTLFCMQHPQLIQGKGLELGCGVGLGGILSVIGAGIVSGEGDSVPIPTKCSGLTLTDARTNALKKCVDNLRATSFPPKLVQVGNLDFTKKISDMLENQFDFILGNDCVHSNPLVEGFAKTCSHVLKDGKQLPRSLLYISPEYRESNTSLEATLSKDYGIVTKKKELVLERLILAPIVLDNMKDIGRQPMRGGIAAYETKDSTKYSILTLDSGPLVTPPPAAAAVAAPISSASLSPPSVPSMTATTPSGPAMSTYANSLSGSTTVKKYTPPTPKTPVNAMGGYLGNISSAQPFSYSVPVTTSTATPAVSSSSAPAPFAAAAASKKSIMDDPEALRAIELACEQRVEKDFLLYCEKLEQSCNESSEAKIESINYEVW